MAARALNLPADLARLVRAASTTERRSTVCPTGITEVDSLLPDGGIPRGAVTERCAPKGLGFSTSLALAACASIQHAGRAQHGDATWCAFLDPSGSLHGPGAATIGLELGRLLVVRPSLEALTRIAVRIATSKAFGALVIDTAGVPGARMAGSLAPWSTVVRRLAMTLENRDRVILLLTEQEASRPLPLPVAMRVELAQPEPGKLSLKVAKERHGRVVSAPIERDAPRTKHEVRAALARMAERGGER
ncbi:MAG: recombinase A [Polyangiaceae bacterium]